MMELALFELYILSNALDARVISLNAQLNDRAWDDAYDSQARVRKDLYDAEQLRNRILQEIEERNRRIARIVRTGE